MAQVKKTKVRDAIIANAYRLFRDQTYLRTSIADIGRAAGIAPSNIYVYFNSKFEIFYAAYEPWLKVRLERLEAELLAIPDPTQRLSRILQAVWIELPTEDNGFANNLMQAVSTTDKDEPFRSDLLSRSEKILAGLLQQALPSGRLTEPECERLAHILLMAFDGFIVRSHVGGTRADMPDIVAIMGKLVGGEPGKASRSNDTGERPDPVPRKPSKSKLTHVD